MIRRRVARRLLPVALLATAVAGWLAYDRGQVGSEATSSPAPADADGPHLALSAPEASSPMLRSPLGCEGVGDADSGSKARGASTPATSALAAAHEGHRLLTSAVSGRDERLARLASVSKTDLASLSDDDLSQLVAKLVLRANQASRDDARSAQEDLVDVARLLSLVRKGSRGSGRSQDDSPSLSQFRALDSVFALALKRMAASEDLHRVVWASTAMQVKAYIGIRRGARLRALPDFSACAEALGSRLVALLRAGAEFDDRVLPLLETLIYVDSSRASVIITGTLRERRSFQGATELQMATVARLALESTLASGVPEAMTALGDWLLACARGPSIGSAAEEQFERSARAWAVGVRRDAWATRGPRGHGITFNPLPDVLQAALARWQPR